MKRKVLFLPGITEVETYQIFSRLREIHVYIHSSGSSLVVAFPKQYLVDRTSNISRPTEKKRKKNLFHITYTQKKFFIRILILQNNFRSHLVQNFIENT